MCLQWWERDTSLGPFAQLCQAAASLSAPPEMLISPMYFHPPHQALHSSGGLEKVLEGILSTLKWERQMKFSLGRLTWTGNDPHLHWSKDQAQFGLMRKSHQPSGAPGGWGGWEKLGRCLLGRKHLRSKRQCWWQVFCKDENRFQQISVDPEKWGGDKNCVAREAQDLLIGERNCKSLFSFPVHTLLIPVNLYVDGRPPQK